MRKIKMSMLKSGDIDGEIITPESLIDSVSQFDEGCIPLTLEHDIRNPPMGRVVSAEIVVLDDGTHLLQGEAEIFEETDDLNSLGNDGKAVKIYDKEIDKFLVSYDQTFKGEDAEELSRELQGLGGEHGDFRQYSVDPVSVLIIAAGIFAIQGIANGFFSKLGEDIYEQFKSILQRYFAKISARKKENLLQFQFFVRTSSNRVVEVNVVMTNPSQQDLNGFFAYVPHQLDELLSNLRIDELDICQLIFSYEFTKLQLLYVLRSDGVPFNLYQIDEAENF